MLSREQVWIHLIAWVVTDGAALAAVAGTLYSRVGPFKRARSMRLRASSLSGT